MPVVHSPPVRTADGSVGALGQISSSFMRRSHDDTLVTDSSPNGCAVDRCNRGVAGARHDCAFAEAPEASSILLRVGTAIIGGLLAILGAAAGSSLTYVLQRKMAVRAEEFAVAERVRAEGMAAFSSFASAAMEARRAQVDRWYQRRDAGPGSDEYRSAKDESFRCRAAAWQALFRAQLVSDNELNSRATGVLEGIGNLHKAHTKVDLDQGADKWREEISLYVEAARLRIAAAADKRTAAR